MPNRRLVLRASALLVAVLTVAACSSDSGSSAEQADGTTTTTRPPCKVDPPPPAVEPTGSSGTGDLLGEVTIEPGPHSVLTGVVTTDTSEPTTVAVTATGPAGEITVPVTDQATSHEIPVLGMRADTDYAVAVTGTTASGASETVDLTFHSGTLPDDMPPLDVTVSEPAAMAQGITLFNAMHWGSPPSAPCEPPRPEQQGWIVGVDAEGEIVWYYRTEHQVTDVSPQPDGTLLMSVHEALIRDVDMLGNDLWELGSRVATTLVKQDLFGNSYTRDLTKPIDIDSAHHEVTNLPNGNILTLSTEVIDLDPKQAKGLCKGVKDGDGKPVPDPTAVVGDIVVELTPDGDVVHEWPFTDYFDPIEDPGSEMCVVPNPVAPPVWFYPKRQGLRDWTHANAVVLDEANNALLVSARHLDAVFAIRYADDADGKAGELLWVMSPHDFGTLTMADGGDFAYHGHAVEPETDQRILYFDNGNKRPGTIEAGGDQPMYSRAVMYRIDPATETATQVWEHRDSLPEGGPLYASFLGDADREPNGNVLITYGGATTEDGVQFSRIVEVVPGDAPDGSADRVVFDLTMGDRKTIGWTAYRADRVPSLYFGTAAS